MRSVGIDGPEVLSASGTGWSACTVRGAGRARNADAVAANVEGRTLAFAVADGVGALAASDRASAAAVSAVIEWAGRRSSTREEDMRALFGSINAAVASSLAGERGATTLVCALISKRRCIVAAVGDSEALAIDERGHVQRLNHLDHVPSRPNALLAWIDGEATFEPHVVRLDILPSRLCLMTDGVAQSLTHAQIAELLLESSVPTAASALVEAARSNGATDDVSAIVITPDVGRGGIVTWGDQLSPGGTP